jgi:hypothetical protein
MKLNWLQNILVSYALKFNVNKALQTTWRIAMEIGIEKGKREQADCLSCPLYKADQIRKTGYDTSAWNAEIEKHTDPLQRKHISMIRTQHNLPRLPKGI